jgi:type VI secretion system protein ImpC
MLAQNSGLQTNAPAVSQEEADEFAALLKQSVAPAGDEMIGSYVDSAIRTLASQAMANADIISGDVVSTINELISRIDAKLSAQVNAVMHDKSFQEMEGAWRGLHYLVSNTYTDATLKVKVMNIAKGEIHAEMKKYSDVEFEKSPLYKRIGEAEYDTLGGEPFGAIVGDYYFDKNYKDVEILRYMAKVGASAHCPFISGADPKLFNWSRWSDMVNVRDISKIFTTPDYAGWRSLRDSEDARYLALCMPRVMARLPYGAKSVIADGFDFEEETDGHGVENYSWMNASYAMAVNINRAFEEHGWTVNIRGVESGGLVSNLPTHTFETDEGALDLKCPTELSISDSREGELSKAGVIPLIHRKNSDAAAFIGAQSVYKPKKMTTDEATASENLSARIPYMFACSRFAHYLKTMVRDKVGSTKNRTELERWLQSWITRYKDGDPDNSTDAVKAQKPLRDAKVSVYDDPENPGFYSTSIHIVPQFQLEGMNIGLSLVSRLKKDGS